MPGIEPVSSAVNAGVAVVKLGQSIAQGIKAGQEEKKLVAPHYSIEEPYRDNQALAERNASQGLGDAAKIVLQNNADRGLTTSIDALIRGGGGVNSFSDLYDTYADNFEHITAMEDEFRNRNQQVYMNQNERMGEELDKQWEINVYKPDQDKRAYIAGLRGMQNQNFSGALDQAAAGALQYGMAKLYDQDGRLTVKDPVSSAVHDSMSSGPQDVFTPANTGYGMIPADKVNIFSRAAGLPSGNGPLPNNQSSKIKYYPWQQ
jgi:hypothetical protein